MILLLRPGQASSCQDIQGDAVSEADKQKAGAGEKDLDGNRTDHRVLAHEAFRPYLHKGGGQRKEEVSHDRIRKGSLESRNWALAKTCDQKHIGDITCNLDPVMGELSI